MLYGLTPLRNEKVSYFDVDMVGGVASSMVFVSVDSRYCGSFNHIFSGCMSSVAITLSRREMPRLFGNLKKDIPFSTPLKYHMD